MLLTKTLKKQTVSPTSHQVATYTMPHTVLRARARMLAFPTITVPAEPVGLFYVFVVSFGYGWGVDDAYNKILID